MGAERRWLKDVVVRDAAMALVVAFVAITAFLHGGGGNQGNLASGPTGARASVMASPTAIPVRWWETPIAMYAVTPPNAESPTPTPTDSPVPTETPTMAACEDGLATPGELCRKYPATSTPSVATAAPTCPSLPATPKTGAVCLWPR